MAPNDKEDLIQEYVASGNSLQKWQEYFNNIYEEKNDEVKKGVFGDNVVAFIRGYTIAHMAEDLGKLAEQVREGDPGGCKKYIGSLFAWLFALATQSGYYLEDVTWAKYPGRCPYCQRPKDCNDAWWTTEQTKKGKEPTVESVDERPKPKSLKEWILLWNEIYGNKVRVAIPLTDIMHKLYEELAEILEELDTYLFRWEEVPGKDNYRLIEFLRRKFGLSWINDSIAIEKTDSRTRKISSSNHTKYLIIKINDNESKATLSDAEKNLFEFDVMKKKKKENGEEIRIQAKVKKDELSATLVGLKKEIPDLLSWLFALIIKLQHYQFISKNTDELYKILYDKFRTGCNACGKPKCECKPLWIYYEKG